MDLSIVRSRGRSSGVGSQDDDARFLLSWLKSPLRMGSVTPSSPVLARAMAAYVDPKSKGPVIELGPGTGPVTAALIERGIDPSRLVLVEYSANSATCCRRASPKPLSCRVMPIILP